MNEKTTKISSFQYVVIAYNVVEVIFAIFFGLLTHSIALTGYGFEGVVESINDYILVGRLKKQVGDFDIAMVKLKQKPIVPVALLSFILASYVLVQSLKILIMQTHPLPSAAGIVIAICSLIFLPLTAFWSYHRANSAKLALQMGIKDIWIYMLLSFGLLLGLALNYWSGLWQADPIVGLLTAGYLYKKSLESLLGGSGQESGSSETIG